jgi:RHS repeat-associated protein
MNHSRQTRVWWCAVVTAAAVMISGIALSPVTATEDRDEGTGVSDTMDLGDGLTAKIDTARGGVQIHFGALGITWDSSQAAGGADMFGLGVGVSPTVSRVDVMGGTRVVTPSGRTYNADMSQQPSGLYGYRAADVSFDQTGGHLSPRPGVDEVTRFGSSLETAGGTTQFYADSGLLVASTDVNDVRQDWVWGDDGQFRGVVDEDGLLTRVNYDTSGEVWVESPVRWDGQQTSIGFGVDNNRLVWVEGPTGERTRFTYKNGGHLLEWVRSVRGLVTEFEWGEIPGTSIPCVERVVTQDINTRQTVNVRTLDMNPFDRMGGHTFMGPNNEGPDVLFARGGDYTWETRLSDADTSGTTVLSRWNTAGVLVRRETTIVDEGLATHSQTFTYPGTHERLTAPGELLPPNHTKPTTTTVMYANAAGDTRNVVESTRFDYRGRLVEHAGEEGSTRTYTYDDDRVEGLQLPLGLPLEQKTFPTTGSGPTSRTVNVLATDRRSIANTTMYVAEPGGVETAKQSVDTVVEENGDHKGAVKEQTVRYADNATAPEQGPKKVTTVYDRHIDRAAGTRTITTTIAAGTDAARTISQVTGLGEGLLIRNVDALVLTTEHTYDQAGRVRTVIDSAGQGTTTQYGLDHVTVTSSPHGYKTTEYQDALGRSVRTVDNVKDGKKAADGSRTLTTTTYSPDGRGATVTDSGERSTNTRVDVFGRVLEKTFSNGMVESTTHNDVAGSVRSGLIPVGGNDLSDAQHVVTTTMDSAQRKTSTGHEYTDAVTTTPTSGTENDVLGRTITATSGDMTVSTQFDVDGSAATQTMTPTNPTQYPGLEITAERIHDLTGTSVHKTLTREDGTTRPGITRVLDEAALTRSETDQAGQTTTYTYTVDGLPETITTPNGSVTTNEYHPTKRHVLATTTHNSDGHIVKATRFEYDNTGNLTSMYDPGNETGTRIRYGYDFVGNTTRITYPDGATLTHTYNDLGQLTHTTDAVGAITEYKYDPQGILQGATQTISNNQIGRIGYTYDSYARVHTISGGNGVTTEYTYTAGNQIATQTVCNKGDNQPTCGDSDDIIEYGAYTYDSHGNLTTNTTTRTIENTTTTQTTTYEYDAYNHLTASHRREADNTLIDTVYEVNVAGDVTHTSTTTTPPSGQPATTTTGYTINALGHATTVTKDTIPVTQYFTDGNLTRDYRGNDYTYTVDDRTKTVTTLEGTTIEYEYYVDGTRATETTHTPETTTTTRFYYTPTGTVANDIHTKAGTTDKISASYLLTPTGRHTRYLTGNTDPAALTDTGYYLHNPHGDITALTNQTGRITVAYTYSDYGIHTTTRTQPVSTLPGRINRFLYTGAYINSGTGNYYLNARDVDLTQHRFTTRDDAPLLNTFGYVANPLTFHDPTGNFAELAGVFIFFAALDIALVGSTLTSMAAATMSKTMNTKWATLGVGSIIAGGGGSALALTNLVTTNPNAHNLTTPESVATGASSLLTAASLAITGAFIKRAHRNNAPATPNTKKPEADAISPEDLETAMSIQAKRFTTNKNGETKTVYHATPKEQAALIKVQGFKLLDEKDALIGRSEGNGMYVARVHSRSLFYMKEKGIATGNARVFHVELNIQKALKIVPDGMSDFHYIRNPAWHKSSDESVSKRLKGTPTFSSPREGTEWIFRHGGDVAIHYQTKVSKYFKIAVIASPESMIVRKMTNGDAHAPAYGDF